jgi:hypothetical protein
MEGQRRGGWDCSGKPTVAGEWCDPVSLRVLTLRTTAGSYRLAYVVLHSRHSDHHWWYIKRKYRFRMVIQNVSKENKSGLKHDKVHSDGVQ